MCYITPFHLKVKHCNLFPLEGEANCGIVIFFFFF